MANLLLAAPRSLATPAVALAALCLCAHLAANGHYGVFRDELYFIACGERPALGYVDQPPLVPLIAAASHAWFGVALTPLRLAPALAMAATVALTANFAKRLGGGSYAQWLGGLATLLSPVLLVDGVLLSTDMLQPLTWLACSWLLVRLIETRDERIWLAFGVVVAISLWSKYLIGFFLVGLAFGIVATPLRRSLAKPWIYAGAAVAVVLVAPNVLWQAAHGWPFLELSKAGASGKNLALSPLAFLGQQALIAGPTLAPLWVAGLWSLAARPGQPELRAFPIAYVVMTAIFLLAHGKAYYLAAFYPTLFAAGAVAFERWFPSRALRWTVAGVFVVGGLLAVPLALPILPPDRFIAYSRALGLTPSVTATERGAQSQLPQYFADMFGWREMAEQVSAVYQALPETDRRRAVFFGRNYGEAAALEIYGPSFGGPPAISGHNSYFLWGPDGYDGSVVIVLGAAGPRLAAKYYDDIRTAGRIENPYAMPSETNVSISVLRSPRVPLSEIWPALKHYE
ncbi:MAG TPA: glycosyltransferase family 39 protein [Roseiarcus sp.]